MKEKLISLLKGENLKQFSWKVFTKKKVGTAIAVIVLLAGLRIGYSLAFEVKGTVLKVDSNSIVVANFLGTKTVNTGDYPIDNNRIAVGEKIEITKNLSGDVTSIRVGGGRQGGSNRLDVQSGRGMQFGQGQARQGQQGQVGQGRQSQGAQRQGQSGQGRSAMMPGKGAPDGTSSASLNQGDGSIQNPGGGKQ